MHFHRDKPQCHDLNVISLLTYTKYTLTCPHNEMCALCVCCSTTKKSEFANLGLIESMLISIIYRKGSDLVK